MYILHNIGIRDYLSVFLRGVSIIKSFYIAPLKALCLQLAINQLFINKSKVVVGSGCYPFTTIL